MPKIPRLRTDEPLKTFLLKLPQEQLDALDKLANDNNMAKAEIVRRCLDAGLAVADELDSLETLEEATTTELQQHAALLPRLQEFDALKDEVVLLRDENELIKKHRDKLLKIIKRLDAFEYRRQVVEKNNGDISKSSVEADVSRETIYTALEREATA